MIPTAGIARSSIVRAVLLSIAAMAALGVIVFGGSVANQAPPSPSLTTTLSPTPTVALTTSEVAAIGKASTVRIAQGSGFGSGVYLGNGQVLTALHVVRTTADITVSFDERQVGTARIVRSDANVDLALLTVSGLDAVGARAITWGDSTSLQEGDPLVALGYPGGLPLLVTVGVVTRLREDGGRSLVQTDASLAPGMSGGPVLDARAHLIGIADFISARDPSVNLAIASKTARDFVEGH